MTNFASPMLKILKTHNVIGTHEHLEITQDDHFLNVDIYEKSFISEMTITCLKEIGFCVNGVNKQHGQLRVYGWMSLDKAQEFINKNAMGIMV